MQLNYKEIGQRIQARRRAKHVTQEAMAEALEFSVGFISQVERGVTKLSLDSLYAITQYLDCTVADIMDDNTSHTTSFEQVEWNTLYCMLPPKEQQLLYHLLKSYIEYR